jgi:hypothetical protein
MSDRTDAERLARVEVQLESVARDLERLVTRAEFLPVKTITYGIAGGVLTAFLTAVIVRTFGG